MSRGGHWLASTDHRKIGISELLVAGAAFLLGLTFALLLRLELLSPGRTMVDADVFMRLFSAHGFVMMLLCVLPVLPAGFGNFLLPGVLGVDKLAAPWVARLALHLHLWAVGLSVLGILLGATTSGWTLSPLLQNETSIAVALLAAAAHLMGLSLAITGLNHLATVLGARGANHRVPLLGWSLALGGLLQVLAAPVIGGTALLMFLQQIPGSELVGLQGLVDTLDYSRLLGFFTHATTILVLVPGMGLAAAILDNQESMFAPRWMLGSLVALAALWVLGSGIRFVGATDHPASDVVASAFMLATLVPGSLLLFGAIMSLRYSPGRSRPALLFVLSFILSATVGGLSGVFLAHLTTGPMLLGTAFESAHMHLLLAGAGLSIGLAALYHWWPQLIGYALEERLGNFAAALVFGGLQLTFLPQLYLGLQGTLPRLDHTPLGGSSMELVSTIGSWLLALGFWFVLMNLMQSLRSSRVVEASASAGLQLESKEA